MNRTLVENSFDRVETFIRLKSESRGTINNVYFDTRSPVCDAVFSTLFVDFRSDQSKNIRYANIASVQALEKRLLQNHKNRF